MLKYKIGMSVFAAIIVVYFFLPWVNVDSPLAGGINKIFSGSKSTTFTKISGFQVPILANRPDSTLMINIIQLFNPGVKDADKKSYLIWGIPGLAVLMFVLFWLLGKNKWLNLAFGLTGVLIFSVAVFEIATTNLDKTVMKVTISFGLWMVLVAYLCIGLLCGINFISLMKEK